MRFLGYTLANEAETPTEPPRPELYEEMGTFVGEAISAGVIVATGGISPTSEGVKISLKDGEYTVVDGPVCRGEGDRRRLGADGVPRPGRGHRVVEAFPRRAGRGRSAGPSRVGPRIERFRRLTHHPVHDRLDAVVVESVACRPPIRLPRSRRCSVSSSPVSWRHWHARAAGTWDWPRIWRRTLSWTPWRSGLSEGTPRNPGAWLTAVGKRKAIDRFRRDRVLAAKYADVGALGGYRRRRGCRPRPRGRLRRRDRGRPPPPDLRGVPPGAWRCLPVSR